MTGAGQMAHQWITLAGMHGSPMTGVEMKTVEDTIPAIIVVNGTIKVVVGKLLMSVDIAMRMHNRNQKNLASVSMKSLRIGLLQEMTVALVEEISLPSTMKQITTKCLPLHTVLTHG